MLTAVIRHDPDRTPVVVLAGQLDLATAAVAEAAFEQLAPAGTNASSQDVVVDMTDLGFMDSSGLSVLLVAVMQGRALRLRHPSDLIRQIIAATGLGQTLPIEP